MAYSNVSEGWGLAPGAIAQNLSRMSSGGYGSKYGLSPVDRDNVYAQRMAQIKGNFATRQAQLAEERRRREIDEQLKLARERLEQERERWESQYDLAKEKWKQQQEQWESQFDLTKEKWDTQKYETALEELRRLGLGDSDAYKNILRKIVGDSYWSDLYGTGEDEDRNYYGHYSGSFNNPLNNNPLNKWG